MLKLRILILDDDLLDAWIINKEIKKNNPLITCKTVHTKGDFLKYLAPFQPDIIISDYNMPEFSGLDALIYIKENDIKIPVIIVSGGLKQDQMKALFNHGACDIISKDDLPKLYPVIKKIGENTKNQ